jgi:hypothetical protein
MDLAIIPKVDIVLRLEGKSTVADEEVEFAEKLDIPIAFGQMELIKLLNEAP